MLSVDSAAGRLTMVNVCKGKRQSVKKTERRLNAQSKAPVPDRIQEITYNNLTNCIGCSSFIDRALSILNPYMILQHEKTYRTQAFVREPLSGWLNCPIDWYTELFRTVELKNEIQFCVCQETIQEMDMVVYMCNTHTIILHTI